MTTYDFTYHRFKGGEPVTVTIDQDDEVRNITLDGKYLGNMIPDKDAEFGYSTDNEDLKPELEGIALALNEIEAMNKFPVALREMFGENILGYAWENNKDLKIIAHSDTDLVEFAGVVRDQMYDVVSFERPLYVYLSKAESDHVEEIHVNC